MTTTHEPSWRAWSPQEVAEHLGVTQWAVYRLLQSGELAHTRIGRQYRVADSVLRDFAGQEPAPTFPEGA